MSIGSLPSAVVAIILCIYLLLELVSFGSRSQHNLLNSLGLSRGGRERERGREGGREKVREGKREREREREREGGEESVCTVSL